MQKVRESLQSVESVVVCAAEITTQDLAHAIIAFTKYMQETGKSVGIIIANKLSPKIDEIFEKHSIVYTSTASPLRYVVSIDYGDSGIDKVLHDVDEENNKVQFFIVPSKNGFDFDNVEFEKEGTNYDITVCFDLKSFQEMGDIYSDADHLFKDNQVITFTENGVDSLGDQTVSLRGNQTYSALMRHFIGHQMTDEIKDLLLSGLIDDIPLLEGGATVEEIGELHEAVRSGISLDQMMQRKYYSKSYKNLDLQIKLMNNIRVDKASDVIWSIVSHEDLKFTGIDRATLNTKGKILFNISREFKLAFAAYEIEKGLIKVVVESNDTEKYSASNIAGVFGGKGNDYHATFIMANTPRKDFEKNIFSTLENLYNIEVKSNLDIENANLNTNSHVTSDSDSFREELVEMKSTEIINPIEPLTNPHTDGINTTDMANSPVVFEAEIDNTESEYTDLLD